MAETSKFAYSAEMLSTNSDVLVKVVGAGKKFCRDFKKSLWYGAQDIIAELAPGIRNAERHRGLRPQEFWAVDNVSFELRRGECFGLIGRNGAGKTTLLKMLNGLIKPDNGRIQMRGRVGALIALGAGFNPILTGRENVYVNASVLGLSKKEIDNKLEEIVDFAEIEEFIDSPAQTYSSGMRVRLGFAIVATAVEPDILLIDEILAVGDFEFKNKCFNLINKLKKNGVASILVSHNIPNIMQYADFCLWLDKGKIKKIGHTNNVCSEYLSSQIKGKNNNPSIQNLEELYGGVFLDESQIKNVEVKFTDKNNNTIDKINPFEPIWLNYSFYCSTSDLLGITFKFHKEDGSVLFIINNILDRIDISTSKKYISGKIKINALNLVPDRYVIVLVVQKGPEFLYRKVVNEFTVYSSENNIYPAMISGFMQVDHTWESLLIPE